MLGFFMILDLSKWTRLTGALDSPSSGRELSTCAKKVKPNQATCDFWVYKILMSTHQLLNVSSVINCPSCGLRPVPTTARCLGRDTCRSVHQSMFCLLNLVEEAWFHKTYSMVRSARWRHCAQCQWESRSPLTTRQAPGPFDFLGGGMFLGGIVSEDAHVQFGLVDPKPDWIKCQQRPQLSSDHAQDDWRHPNCAQVGRCHGDFGAIDWPDLESRWHRITSASSRT